MGNKGDLNGLIARLKELRERSKDYEGRYRSSIELAHPKNQSSAVNLAHYLALRTEDLRDLQKSLHEVGVSTLVGTESHVLAGIAAVSEILHRLRGTTCRGCRVPVSAKRAGKLRRKNTNRLLGKKLKGAATRIMVTLPPEAADDGDLVHDLVMTGMSVARINCAHDAPEEWERMIANVDKARSRTGRNCKVAMDLAGPKLRTGAIRPGPCVVRLRPRRDAVGRIAHHARVLLGTNPGASADSDHTHLPAPDHWVRQLRESDEICFEDTRGKTCVLVVEAIEQNSARARCDKSAYVLSGTKLSLNREDIPHEQRDTAVGVLPPTEQAIILRGGDKLILTRDSTPGTPAALGADGSTLAPPVIPCTLPEVFSRVKPGEPISFDDGRVDGVVSSVAEDRLEVEIRYARGGAAQLRSDKGINFPRSDLGLTGLTAKDRSDLEFVVNHADIVNMSFVNHPEDIGSLLWELDRLGGENTGIIVKIETMSGFHNLPLILFEALRHRPVGVMIARGDLAVEAGWKNLAKIQEEIMWMCRATHVPIVWATQVLESLAKKGAPSRAEIADVVMAQRASCVMLNKGPHILETVRLLDQILGSMESYWESEGPTWPALELTDDWANITYTSPGLAIAKLDLRTSRKRKKER